MIPPEEISQVAGGDPYPEDEYDEREIGCVNCDGGWNHGCCDDLCYGCNEPQWCDLARPCRTCNPNGEILWRLAT